LAAGMPKEDPMSQVSRPFQIAFAAVALLVVVWFVALRGHNSSSTEPTVAASPSQTSTYTGSAPGVAGLTKDIQKAHQAAGEEAHTNGDEQAKSSKLTGEGAQSTSGTAKSGTATSSSSTTASSSAQSSVAAGKAGSSTASNTSSTTGKSSTSAAAKSKVAASRQAAIEHELAHGKVALLLFWNPKSSDDEEVRGQLHDISRRDGRVAVHVALPFEIGDFGGYTQGIQILQTPTLLVIGANGQATTLVGLTDARTIQQTIGNALRGGAGKVQVPTLTAWVNGSQRGAYIGRANALCKKPIKAVFSEGTIRTAVTSFHTFLLTIINPFLSKLGALSPPAADRGHVERLLGMYRHAGSKIDGAIDSVHSGNLLAARTQLLEAQASADEGSEGLADYGLTACFPYH
jgi:hypothetical protein